MKSLKARRDELAEGKYPLEVVPPTYIRQQLENRYHFVHGFDTAVAELMPEMEELVKALEFYANEKSWLKDEMFGWHICGEHKIYYWSTEAGVEHDIESREDTGDKARAALTRFKEFMGNNESKQITVFEMEAKMETITVNGKTYYAEPKEAQQFAGDIKICILQRGWVMVGKLERNGSECKLNQASVIRHWGTTKGLGELAANGPLKDTKLDKCNGLVEFDWLTVVATISCNEEKWVNEL